MHKAQPRGVLLGRPTPQAIRLLSGLNAPQASAAEAPCPAERVPGIDQQVERDLLNLIGIGQGHRSRLGQVELEHDVPVAQLLADQEERFGDDGVEVDWPALAGPLLPPEGAQVIDDLRHLPRLALDALQLPGDLLVVGLNSDASVRSLKGPSRPVNAVEARAAVLSALQCVDYVTVFNEPTPIKLIEAVRPDVLVKGADYAKADVVGATFVESYGGRVHLAALRDGFSTTDLIQKMKAA